jgi:hypothetical protein
MKPLLLSTALTLSVFLAGCSKTAQTRPVRLVITGPEGQHFKGSYVADGVTNNVNGETPKTIKLHAKDVTYEFKREGGQGEFRVALLVEDLYRTSTTSDKRQGVRGWYHSLPNGEKYGAAGF